MLSWEVVLWLYIILQCNSAVVTWLNFSIRVGHNPNFGLCPVAILPWSRRKRRKAISTHLSNPSRNALTVYFTGIKQLLPFLAVHCRIILWYQILCHQCDLLYSHSKEAEKMSFLWKPQSGSAGFKPGTHAWLEREAVPFSVEQKVKFVTVYI